MQLRMRQPVPLPPHPHACPARLPAPPACPACRYQTWSEAVTKAPASVVVLYASDYGFSDRLSQVGAPACLPAYLPAWPSWLAGAEY